MEFQQEPVCIERVQSNIYHLLEHSSHVYRFLSQCLLRYYNIRCESGKVLELADCHHVHTIIAALDRFKKDTFIIDLSHMINAYDHMINARTTRSGASSGSRTRC